MELEIARGLFIILCIGLLIYLLFFSKHDAVTGVKQKIKIYGNLYKIRTVVFYNGQFIKEWYDEIENDKEAYEYATSKRMQGTEMIKEFEEKEIKC